MNNKLLEKKIEEVKIFSKSLYNGCDYKKQSQYPYRHLSPQKTNRKLSKRTRNLCGITRVSDITGLDLIGIPTYIAIRPMAFSASPLKQGLISVYNGKGFTKIQAKVSAIMEAIERYSAESFDREMLISSHKELKNHTEAIEPKLFNSSDEQVNNEWNTSLIEWSLGINLISNEPVAAPSVNVYFPYITPLGTKVINTFHSTTGLASGNTLLEAIIHGTLEVIERHSISPDQNDIESYSISLESIKDRRALSLIKKIKKSGITPQIKYFKNIFNIPVFEVWINDPITQDPYLICNGSGCHLIKEVALIRALSEAIQTRLTIINGTREDIEFKQELRQNEDIYKKILETTNTNYNNLSSCSFELIDSYTNKTFKKDLSIIKRKLIKNGFKNLIIFNLTHPRLKIPVIRACIPSLPIKIKNHDHVREILGE